MSSETKIHFIYQNQKIEMKFNKNDFVKDILASFALKVEKSIDDFNFLYSGEKIAINVVQKLCDLNNKDEEINISVYPKNESTLKPVNLIMPMNLKFRRKCKFKNF